MGLDSKFWFINVKLMRFAFAGQLFQFIARPGNVDDYGFNFTLMHPLNLWKVQNGTFEKLVLGPKCIGPKYIWAKVGFGPKYSLGRNVPWGQSECGAKVVLGPNWMWAYVYGVHKVIIKNSSIFSHNAINVAQFCHVKWRSKVQRAVIRHPPAAITGNFAMSSEAL